MFLFLRSYYINSFLNQVNNKTYHANRTNDTCKGKKDNFYFGHIMIYARGLGIHEKHAILQLNSIASGKASDDIICNVVLNQRLDGLDKLVNHLNGRHRAEIHTSDGFEFGGEVVNWCFHNVGEELLTRLFYHIWQLCTHLFTLKANYFHLLP